MDLVTLTNKRKLKNEFTKWLKNYTMHGFGGKEQRITYENLEDKIWAWILDIEQDMPHWKSDEYSTLRDYLIR